jgi:hypothetical protein
MSETPLKNRLTRSEPDQATVERVWQRVRAHEPQRARQRLLAVMVAAACVITIVAFWPQAELATDTGESLTQALDESRPVIALNDGSQLTLSNDAKLRTRSLSHTAVELEVDNGRIEVFVKPKGPRAWSFLVGDVRVDVVGTRFSILRQNARVRVDVDKGTVAVSGLRVAGGRQLLNAGQVFEVGAPSASAPAIAPSQPTPQVSSAPIKTERKAPQRKPETLVSKPAAPEEAAPQVMPTEDKQPPKAPAADWRALAARGEFRQAATALGGEGLAREAAAASEPSDLFVLADISVAAGDDALAVQLLDRVVKTATSNQTRAVAAYKKGVSLLLKSNTRAAAESLEQALTLGLPESMRKQAIDRVTDAWIRAGEPERARRWKQ